MHLIAALEERVGLFAGHGAPPVVVPQRPGIDAGVVAAGASGNGRFRTGTSSATGLPLRVMVMVSPWSTRSSSRDKLLLASWTL